MTVFAYYLLLPVAGLITPVNTDRPFSQGKEGKKGPVLTEFLMGTTHTLC